MATLSFYITIDMRTFAGFDYYSFFSGTVVSSSSLTHLHVTGATYYHRIAGVDLMTPSYVPTSGTITDWTYGAMTFIPNPADPYNTTPQEYAYWTFAGMALSAAAFADAVGTASMGSLMPTILSGHDAISGSVANDYLLGYDGNDTVTGGAGNDTLDGGAGNDVLDGGIGTDTLTYASATASVAINLNSAGAQNTLGAGFDTVSNFERVSGSNFNDSIVGNGLANLLKGGAGNDALNGAAGNDALYGESGNDVLNGGLGADTLAGSVGNDSYLIDAADTIVEQVGAGTDLVKAAFTYTLGANLENLTLLGTAAINGTGNALANTIVGNGAANVINGGAGDDVLNGGGGIDTVSYAGAAAAITVSLWRTAAQDTGGAGVDTLSNFERIIGSSFNDGLAGNSEANILSGGAGADRLIGGTGNDTLSGGSGSDQFWFDTTPHGATNVDSITDFSVADDIIYLAQGTYTDVFTPEVLLAASAFHIGVSAHDADDRIIYNSATGRLYYDADGTGAGEQLLFAQLTAGLALTNADFYLFD